MKFEEMINQVICGDCLEVMRDIPDKSIDMILCDLPYGTTACEWDTIIPFKPLWEQYKRIIKDNRAIVLTASQPFTSALVMSNIKDFRYCWVWNKKKAANFLFGNKMPLKITEDVCVFYEKQPTYNPIKIINPRGSEKPGRKGIGNTIHEHLPNCPKQSKAGKNYEADKLLPTSILEFSKPARPFHPTQKPVALFEYLIKTYTNEGDLVLDNCAGSGTTGVACKNLNRNFILIEKEEKYCEIARQRLRQDLLL
jgi:site-specific DNA-methyltransferase (adenine-specific)